MMNPKRDDSALGVWHVILKEFFVYKRSYFDSIEEISDCLSLSSWTYEGLRTDDACASDFEVN